LFIAISISIGEAFTAFFGCGALALFAFTVD
jgi:hypothetical protein